MFEAAHPAEDSTGLSRRLQVNCTPFEVFAALFVQNWACNGMRKRRGLRTGAG